MINKVISPIISWPVNLSFEFNPIEFLCLFLVNHQQNLVGPKIMI